jgi:hypothetical protein
MSERVSGPLARQSPATEIPLRPGLAARYLYLVYILSMFNSRRLS